MRRRIAGSAADKQRVGNCRVPSTTGVNAFATTGTTLSVRFAQYYLQ